MPRGLFVADGSLREVHIPVEGPPEWMAVLQYLMKSCDKWTYTVDGASAGLPSSPGELFRRDGRARVFRWWVGHMELRTYFLDPDDFCFDFMPAGEVGEAERMAGFLGELAARFQTELVVLHEHGDMEPTTYPGRKSD